MIVLLVSRLCKLYMHSGEMLFFTGEMSFFGGEMHARELPSE